MSEWTQEKKQRIANALTRVGANQPCHRCGNNRFSLLDGFFNLPLVPTLGDWVLGGPTVPAVVVACTRCGYLSYHALGVLGLLQEFAPPGTTVGTTPEAAAEGVKR